MRLAVLGVNHKTACLSLREQVALNTEASHSLVRTLVNCAQVSEAVALSTCNRTEIYLAGTELPLRTVAKDCLCSSTGVCRTDLDDSVYYYENMDAVEHVFSVAGSLDSMVLGEAQILAQLKEAYSVAQEAGTTGPMLNRLLRRSFEVGKRVRSETKISEASLSIASVSVDLARNVFGDLADHPVLVIGAGEMAELVVTHLKGHGVNRILVANRTYERAVALAEKFGGEAVRFQEEHEDSERGRKQVGSHPHNLALAQHLSLADIVISSTGSSDPIIGRRLLEGVMRRRKNRPIFLIDIAVPRDIDSEVNRVNNAYLYDIDDLQEVVASNLGEREREAVRAREIIAEEVGSFEEWARSLTVLPTLVAFREWASAIKDEELTKYLGRMPDLSEEDREKVQALAHSIINKILHPPTMAVKERAAADEGQLYAEALRTLFQLNGAGRSQAEALEKDRTSSGFGSEDKTNSNSRS